MAYVHSRRARAPGPVVFDPAGLELSAEEREMFAHPLVGGVILFRHNYADPAQLRELISACRRAHSGPLMVMVDHEGGRVQRFREHFSALPPGASLGWQYQIDAALALSCARSIGQLMAYELAPTGIDLNLAPVVDLAGAGDVIGDRAFSDDPDAVVWLTQAIIRGMQDGGLGAAVKHFPGHGGVSEDTHTESAIDSRDLESILARDGQPFKYAVSAGVDGVVPSHVCFPAVDDRPVGYSSVWLQKELRGSLGFDGLILSDDISMAAATLGGGVTAAASAALEAGCDLVLSCQKPRSAVALLDGLRAVSDDSERADRFENFFRLRQARISDFDSVAARREVLGLLQRWEGRAS